VPRLALCLWCARKNTNFADPKLAPFALTHFRSRRKLLRFASMTDTATVNDNKNKQLIDMLRRSRLFRDYENVFTRATGLPLALRPLEYWQLEHHEKTNENPFCALLAQRSETLAVCLQSHAEIVRHTGTKARTETCPFGLTETAVPVRLGDKTIGFLRIGQVLRRSAIQSDRKRAAAKLSECDVPFSGRIRKAWETTPIIPKEKYSATVRLLTFFAEQLSALINQITLEKQNAEPPLVCKAREYIEQHKMEPLSLTTVAQASGASVFHFCKVFKRTTGLKFTDYVARVRLEDAKTQLLNPSRRISEIAYDVGFQSLTQFNRMFKRVFGQSPTEFREHLGARNQSVKAA
jgi:AraC-like DNA-binding protein/ligand-binding sensor protein